jgi:hypothetical protein
MKQAVKATALLLFVSLLSGCSSAEAKACESAQIAHKNYYDKAGEYNGEAVLTITPEDKRKKLLAQGRSEYFRSQKIVENNPKCFTPEEVVEAQIYLRIK